MSDEAFFANALPDLGDIEVCESPQPVAVKKLSPKPKQVTNNKYSERFDKHKLYHILQHDEEYRPQLIFTPNCDNDPFILGRKILSKSHDGVLSVQHFQHNNKGRQFAIGGVSIANMCKQIRHAICNELYVDIDMVNAHPVILNFICEQNDIPHEELSYYIANREECFKQMKCDRADAKRAYLTVINGDNNVIDSLPVKSRNLKHFASEMKNIREALIKKMASEYTQHVKYTKKERSRTNNFEGSFINSLMCDCENQILKIMLAYFGNPREAVLCFDGVMLPIKGEYDLRGCEIRIKEQIGIDMKLDVKSMDSGFKIENCEQYNEVLVENIQPFDKTDPYVWNDLLTEYAGQPKEFESYEDLCNELLPKLKRVVAYLTIGKGMFVKKLNISDYMFDVSPAKGTDLALEFYVKEMKSVIPVGKLIKQSSQHLVYSHTCCKPDKSLVQKHEFNFWSGYRANTVETVDMKLIDPILDLMKTVWADGDERVYKVLLYFFSELLKHPHTLPNKQNALVVIGDQGIGKDFLLDFISEFVMGNHLVSRMCGIGDAVGNFNGRLKGKVLCVVNEMASTREEFRSNFDKIKPNITNKCFDVNHKGIEAFTVDNISSWILMSNHDDILYLEKGDRRYTCLRASSIYKNNRQHFEQIAKQCFNNKCGDHFYTYLMNLTADDIIHPEDLGDTALKKELKEMSLSSAERFYNETIVFRTDNVDQKYDEDDIIPWQMAENIQSKDLYYEFTNWCKVNGERTTTHQKFGRVLKKAGLKSKRASTGNVWVW